MRTAVFQEVELGKVCTIQNGFAFDGARFSRSSGMPLIRIRDLKTNTPSERFDGDFETDYVVRAGDLLVGMDGEFRCYEWRGPEALLNQRVCRLIPDIAQLDKDYLRYAIGFPLQAIEQDTAFTTVKHLSSKDMLKFLIPLPSLEQQKRIAAILNEQMAAVERARAAAAEQASALLALQTQVVSEIFAKAWSFQRSELHALCFIRGGKRLPAGSDFSRERTPFAYLRVVDFRDGSIDLQGIKFLTKDVQQQIRQYIINRDDVYISIAGTIGLAGTIPDSLDGANLTENAARLVVRDRSVLGRDFLAVYLNTKQAQAGIKARTNQVGQPKLALERLGTLEVPMPPLSMQEQIARKVVEARQIVRAACASFDERRKALDVLPAALLRRAFSGGL